MEPMQPKRDRLLRQTARVYGLCGLFTGFAVLSTPGSFGVLSYWVSMPLFAIAGVCLGLLSRRRSPWLVVGIVAAAMAITVAIALITPVRTPSIGMSIIALLGAAVPGALIAVLAYRRGWLWFWLAGIPVVGTVVLVLPPTVHPLAIVIVLLGLAIAAGVGYLVTSSIRPALRQVAEVGRAHRAERQASELEAQRRQSARLLHDTVLATLTLLAHSGRGVSEAALREQARNDAHLLRQLRLGEPLVTLPEAGYRPELVEETTLGTTLDSVKQRFEQLGLDVTWHGTARVLLPPGVLDGFLFAISECLENVRRHSGVMLAHVTITEDERAVRAMITDAGKGFAVDQVGHERFGLKESVIARLSELGGSARLFSSPGAGTTVLLEVPR